MITTRAQLQASQEYLASMEAGLEQLRQKFMPNWPDRFELLGARYSEEIVRVRAEIDAFIQLSEESNHGGS